VLQFLDSSQLVWSRTDNGWDWHDNCDVPRQSLNGVPALVAIKGQLVTVYSSSDKSHDGQLLQTLYILGQGWTSRSWIGGQKAGEVAPTATPETDEPHGKDCGSKVEMASEYVTTSEQQVDILANFVRFSF
jgi:hypothetical protein